MHNYLFPALCFLLAYCHPAVAQLCRLNAEFESATSRVILDWNMITHAHKTSYQLLRSSDRKIWEEIVTDKLLQHYNPEVMFDYEDNVELGKTFYYRLRIFDTNNRTITFSNTVLIHSGSVKSLWVIYPNPVNQVLTLVSKGNSVIRGVIHVLVQDATGKIVIKYRAASIYKKLEIPVSNLRRGIYAVQISILDEIVMKQTFVKQ